MIRYRRTTDKVGNVHFQAVEMVPPQRAFANTWLKGCRLSRVSIREAQCLTRQFRIQNFDDEGVLMFIEKKAPLLIIKSLFQHLAQGQSVFFRVDFCGFQLHHVGCRTKMCRVRDNVSADSPTFARFGERSHGRPKKGLQQKAKVRIRLRPVLRYYGQKWPFSSLSAEGLPVIHCLQFHQLSNHKSQLTKVVGWRACRRMKSLGAQ